MKRTVVIAGLILLILVSSASEFRAYNECTAPPFVAAGAPPLVMLALSKDHTAFFESYNDTFDVDGDGSIDNTYKDSIDYYGYFDSVKCYEYDSTNKRFNPIGMTTQGTHYCDSSDASWSGNFLNWATMTRMDVLRKVLYGGYRGSKRTDSGDTDTASLTVLERVFLPTDGHTWVKVYSGSDLYRLTQYSASDVSSFPDQSISIFNVTATSEMTSCPTGLRDLPIMRVAKGKYHDWDVTEVKQGYYSNENSTSSALKPGSAQRLTDLAVRVKACTAPLSDTEQDLCKSYTANNYKPIGLLQKYGNSIHFGLLSGSYGQNAAGGILRKPIAAINNEINADGTFKNNDGIIKTVNNIFLRGYSVSEGKYSGTTYGEVLKPGMPGQNNWGNPIGEMLYESLRYFAGKEAPTAAYATTATSYSSNPTTYDVGLGLPGPAWDEPYESHPYCAQPYVLVLTDIYPSYDSDQLPGSAFATFGGDLSGLDVATMTNAIGSNENLPNSTFIGEVHPTTPDNICSAKTPFTMGKIRGLCPGYSGIQGSYYSAAVAHYGRTTDLRSSVPGEQKPATYVVALSNPLPTITVTTASGKSVTISPVSKATGGATPTNCSYVKSRVLEQSMTGGNGTIEIAWEDSYFANDFDKDWIQMLRWKVSGETITVETYLRDKAAGNRMDAGYVISGTTDDGLKMDLKATITNYGAYTLIGSYACTTNPWPDPDGDANACFGGYSSTTDNPNYAPNCYTLSCSQVVYSKRTYSTGTSSAAQYLHPPLWYAAKWGGFRDFNGDGVPGPSNVEWDKDGNGVPDNYFLVANPARLYDQMNQAFIAILARSGTAGAVATVTQEVQGEDMLVRGAFTSYENDAANLVWKGHLEVYWPYEGCSAYLTQSLCETCTGCTWKSSGASGVCSGSIYAFQKPENQYEFCFQHHDHCWEAEEHLPTPASRAIFTYKNGLKTLFSSANMCTADDLLGLTGDSLYGAGNSTETCREMVDWVRGKDGWSLARNRNGWTLGDIVYSTPVVVQQPTLSAVPVGAAGSCDTECTGGCNCSDPNNTCRQQCFYCYRECQESRKRMIYVGANDGMLHAFVAGKWDDDNQTWLSDPASDSEIGKELWAYLPGNLLSELKELARPTYGTEGNCVHRYMVDLSPQAWDAFIDPDGDNGTEPRQWCTVLVGGERGGGDVFFALDVTEPDNPRVLWEFPALRNLVQIDGGSSPYAVQTPYRDKSVYDLVKTLPSSWAVPSVGKLKLSESISFLAATPVSPLTVGSPALSPSALGSSGLSGWVAVVPTSPRIFLLDDLPTSLTQEQKLATLRPNLLMIDIEKGINIFQYLWPLLLETQSSEWPTIQNGANYIPYAPGSAAVLDIWKANGRVGMDGYMDHIYFGDLSGKFYGIKYHVDGDAAKGMEIDFWKTKNIPSPDNSTNIFRSGNEAISTMPAAAFDRKYNLRLYFGTGKYDNIEGNYNDKTDNSIMSFYAVKDESTRPAIDATANVSGTGPITLSGATNGFKWNGFGVDIGDAHCDPLPDFNTTCSWVKTDGTEDCCEDSYPSCVNPCWNCIYSLNANGERVVDSALVAGGLVFFTTFVPNPDICTAGGYAYLYVMDYLCRDLATNPLANSRFTPQASFNFQALQTGQYGKMQSGTKTVGYVAKIGLGVPSRPVLDSSSQYLFVQTSVAQIHRIRVDLLEKPMYLRGWKEED